MRSTIRTRLAPLALGITLLGVLAPAQNQVPASGAGAVGKPAVAADLKPRAILIGASVTAGFACGPQLASNTQGGSAREVSERFLGIELTEEEFLRRAKGIALRSVLTTSYRAAKVRLYEFANMAMFMNPRKIGREQVEVALKRKASLVIGIDFLFWFVNGRRSRIWDPETQKLDVAAMQAAEAQKLQYGLDLIEKRLLPMGITVVIGDIPDMEGCDPRICPPWMIAPRRASERANQRIRAFAQAHERVLLYPLARRAKEMRSDRFAIQLGDDERLGTVAGLLQVDLLHTTTLGSAVLAQDLLNWLAEKLPKEHPARVAGVSFAELLERAGAKEDFARLPKKPAAPTKPAAKGKD
jgi:hypothetical protein